MNRLACGLGLTIMAGVARAATMTPPVVASRCTAIDNAYGTAESKSVVREGQLAGEMIPLVTQMGLLADKAKNAHEPIDKQLSKADLDQFNRIRVQLLHMEFQSAIVSRTSRDMKILSRLCHASLQINGLWKDYIEKHGALDAAFPAWLDRKEVALAHESKHPVYLGTMLHLQSQVPSGEQKLMAQIAQMQKMMQKP